MSPHADSSPTSSEPGDLDPPFESGEFTRAENLPWTGLTLLLAVLGLLLFMAVPMGNPSPQELIAAQRRHSAMLAQESLQAAIEDYHNDHGVWPGVPPRVARTLGPPRYDAAWLERQLQMCSNSTGLTVPVAGPEFAFGPYLPKGIPTNPLNGASSVRILQPGERFESVLDDLYGWVYDPRSGEVRPHVMPFHRLQNSARSTRHVGFGK